MPDDSDQASPFAIMAADRLAMAVRRLISEGVLDTRSEASDALLRYASQRFGDADPIGDLERHVEKARGRTPR